MKKKTLLIISAIILLVALITTMLLLKPQEQKQYIVTFETNGGTKIEDQTIIEGDKVTKPTDPIKEGYKFISWLYENETYDFSKEVFSNMELIANWYEIKEETESYTITFNTDGGSTIPNQIIEEGNLITKPENPTKENYEFIGWYLNEEEYNFETKVNSDIELKAKWEEIKKEEKEEKDIKISTPTLTNAKGYAEKFEKIANLNIISEGAYSKGTAAISGYELYEKNGKNYKLIATKKAGETVELTIDIGENKTYVARAYAYTKENKKIYSEYSNEIVIDNSKVETPTLKPVAGSIGIAQLSIVAEGAYASEGSTSAIKGWELYEKKGSEYTLVKSQEGFNSIEVTVDVGESKTYVAKAYALNKKNEKIYSAYSNEIVIDNK